MSTPILKPPDALPLSEECDENSRFLEIVTYILRYKSEMTSFENKSVYFLNDF